MLIKNRNSYAVGIIIVIWYLLHIVVRSAVIPGPGETIITFFKVLPQPLLSHFLVSLGRILAAVVFSLLAGTSIGLVIGMNPQVDELVSPIIYFLYPVPKIAFLPVFMLLFGVGDLAKIIIIVAIIIFQIIVTTRDGVKGLKEELFYSVRSLGMNKLQVYRHLVIPALLPKIITALRISVGTSIAVLFLAENFATRLGLGYFIMNNWTTANYVRMFSGILALSIMGISLFKVIDYVDNKFCVWIK